MTYDPKKPIRSAVGPLGPEHFEPDFDHPPFAQVIQRYPEDHKQWLEQLIEDRKREQREDNDDSAER